MFFRLVQACTISKMDRPIRVLFLTHNYPRFPGDFSGVFLHVLAKSLLVHNIQPVILAPHDAGTPEREERDGIEIVRFRYDTDDRETLAYRGNMHQVALGSLGGLTRFAKFLRAFQKAANNLIASDNIDLLWGHWLVPAGVVLRRIAGATRLPILLSSHGTDIRLLSKYRLPARLYFAPLIHRVSRWTVVSNYLKEQISLLDPIFREKLSVIPLPHDESVFFPDTSVERNDNQIVSVTRFTDQKRVSVLIGAFSQVNHRAPHTTLHLWGTGPLQSQIEQQIRSLQLQNNVTLHPPVTQSELAGVYRRAGMIVLNSVDEGFGLALTEAMLCGAPVVGVASGGITDIITDGVTGLLARPDDPRDLAEKLSRMLSDSALRDRLAQAGQKSAYERYASGQLSSRYADLIRGAVRP